MILSAAHICPRRGLIGLQPPEADLLSRAGSVADSLGLGRLYVPLLEESLSGPTPERIRFIDGLISALDGLERTGLGVWLIPLANRVLGLDWLAAHLVKAQVSPLVRPSFFQRRLRQHRALDWWSDPPLIAKRIKMFQEVCAALSGHPAVSGWLLLDQAWEIVRPEPAAADLVLRSLIGEIRERDEQAQVGLGLGWRELLEPGLVSGLAGLVDRLRLAGLEKRPNGLEASEGLAGDLMLAAYFGALAGWLWERPIEVEVGWRPLAKGPAREEALERAALKLGAQDLEGLCWLSLTDPEPARAEEPPWSLRPGLDRSGLLDSALEPREGTEELLEALKRGAPDEQARGFIDLGPEEYLSAPAAHLARLWEHFFWD